MKEEGQWSSERRRPHGSTKFGGRSIIPEWASLPPELVEGIADLALSTTGGVAAYMDMRSVCSTWRSAIAKPSPLTTVADLRFWPRQWVMVDLKSRNHGGDDARLFLHVPTGRFRRLRLPVLRDHIVLGASDGLIVLGDRERVNPPCVLNPLTGEKLHFAAPLVDHLRVKACGIYTAVSGGSHPTLVLWRQWEWNFDTVVYAHPTSTEFREEDSGAWITSMVTFQGNIYYTGPEGCVFKFVAPPELCGHELVVIARVSPNVDAYSEGGDSGSSSYLVDSAGELLLVRHLGQALKVFRVDVEHKLLEEVQSLSGCRALFLGNERCLSVDADMFPSVEGDHVYICNMSNCSYSSERRESVYNLRDGSVEVTSSGTMLRINNHRLSPLSLIQVLLDYCSDITLF